MKLPDGIHNRFLVPAFLINSVPKAGTHLLAKVVGLFPGIGSAGLHAGQSTLGKFKQPADSAATTISVGVDWPHHVPLSSVQQSLQRMKRGRYATGHIPFSEDLSALLVRLGMKSLLMLRDPRDVVISHAIYVKSSPRHFLFKLYQTLPESERIMCSITGVARTATDDSLLLNINDRYRSVLPWASQRFTYVTCFEKLVGPQGGGSRDVQVQELGNIVRHLGIAHGSRRMGEIADRVFGGTATFRKGLIGSWRERFSAEHKQAFKELAGELVIELGYEKDTDW